MKNHFKNSIRRLLGLCLVVFMITSCEYKDVVDVEYPDQVVYLPASRNGVYKIDKAAASTGSPVKYRLDNDKVVLLTSVYRAGVENKGNVSVDIISNPDSVNVLIASGDLTEINEDETTSTPTLLPNDKFSFPSTVDIKSGEETGSIEIALDLSFLQNHPDSRFAFAIKIAGSNVSVNEKLNTVIIDFNTKVLTATPD